MSGKSRVPDRKNNILNDHQRIGKRLIPPLMQRLSFQEIYWGKHLIPNFVWISLLNNLYGFREGAELALVLPKSVEEATKSNPYQEWFATISSYYLLSKEEKQKTVEILRSKNVFDQYQKALLPLIHFYPSCPMSFLFDFEIKPDVEIRDLERLKKVLESIFDRRSVEATFMQANAINIGFALDKLVVDQSISLAKFSEIEYYPKTEKSRQIAASVRAAVNAIFGNEIGIDNLSWPNYFWNHGLELEKCLFYGENQNG